MAVAAYVTPEPADVAAPAPHVYEMLSDEEAYLYAILTDPSGLDLAEFAWVDEEKPDGCWRAYPMQWSWWRCTDEQQIDRCGRSIGKALDVTTPIPTVSGWTSMGELRVGDMVFDETGAPTRVTAAFDVQLERDCWEVTFDDGNTIVADGDHLWSVWSRPPNRRTGQHAGRAIVRTIDLSTSGRTISRIPVAGPLRTANVDLPVPPYVLGYWLGDGATAHGGLTVGAHDLDEVVSLLHAEGVEARPGRHKFVGLHWPATWVELPILPDGGVPPNGLLTDCKVREVRRRARAGERGSVLAAEFGISQTNIANILAGTARRSAGGPIRKPEVPFGRALNDLGLLGDKHIPAIYMRAPIAQRLALLQGLMDSDGHCTKQSGRCEITLTVETLAAQVYELVASLGLKPFFEKRRASLYGVDCGPAYRIGFAPLRVVPFRLQRKIAALREPSALTTVRVVERRVSDVRPVPSRPVRCITVDSPTSTFLAGHGMIPTHNSESIMARACSFPFRRGGAEMVITGPETQHVDSITERIEPRLTNIRLLSEMLVGGRSGIRHKPQFHVTFRNGSVIHGRIPQKTGLGMKGTHPAELEQDESQDYPEKGWTEIVATLRREVQGAQWRAHGVTKGIPDTFKEYTEDEEHWTVHKYTALHKPTWSKEEEERNVRLYGGTKYSPDYRRNVLGLHGDSTSPVFVMARFMAGVDQQEGSDYNVDEYTHLRISAERIQELVGSSIEDSTDEHVAALEQLLQFPESHRRYQVTWAGMDIGYTIDPSEILVFAEYSPTAEERRRDRASGVAVPLDGQTRLKLLSRIHLERLTEPLQAAAIMHVISFYRPRAFSLDRTGAGQPLLQQVQRLAGLSRLAVYDDEELPEDERRQVEERRAQARGALTVIKGYNFSEKVVIGIDEERAAALPPSTPTAEIFEKAGIRNYVKDAATDFLRDLIDNRRLLLPYDKELTTQWNGQTWSYSSQPADEFKQRRRIFSSGAFHTLDAGRMAALGMYLAPLEELLARPPAAAPPVFVRFIGG